MPNGKAKEEREGSDGEDTCPSLPVHTCPFPAPPALLPPDYLLQVCSVNQSVGTPESADSDHGVQRELLVVLWTRGGEPPPPVYL